MQVELEQQVLGTSEGEAVIENYGKAIVLQGKKYSDDLSKILDGGSKEYWKLPDRLAALEKYLENPEQVKNFEEVDIYLSKLRRSSTLQRKIEQGKLGKRQVNVLLNRIDNYIFIEKEEETRKAYLRKITSSESAVSERQSSYERKTSNAKKTSVVKFVQNDELSEEVDEEFVQEISCELDKISDREKVALSHELEALAFEEKGTAYMEKVRKERQAILGCEAAIASSYDRATAETERRSCLNRIGDRNLQVNKRGILANMFSGVRNYFASVFKPSKVKRDFRTLVALLDDNNRRFSKLHFYRNMDFPNPQLFAVDKILDRIYGSKLSQSRVDSLVFYRHKLRQMQNVESDANYMEMLSRNLRKLNKVILNQMKLELPSSRKEKLAFGKWLDGLGMQLALTRS